MSGYIKKYIANILASISAVVLVALFVPFLMGTLFSSAITFSNIWPIWLIIIICFLCIFNFYFSNLKYVKVTMIVLILVLIPYGFLFYMHVSILLYANTLSYKSQTPVSGQKEQSKIKVEQSETRQMYAKNKNSLLWTPEEFNLIKNKNTCAVNFIQDTEKAKEFFISMVERYDTNTNSTNMNATRIKSIKLSNVIYNDSECTGVYILDLDIGGKGWNTAYNRHQELLLDSNFSFVSSYAVDNDDFLLRKISVDNEETALSVSSYKSEIESLFANNSVYVADK